MTTQKSLVFFPIYFCHDQESPSWRYVHITLSLILSAHHTSPQSHRPLETRNPGDRHGLFHFHVPTKFQGAVLGPETYGWLLRRYGQDSIDKEGIFRARILSYNYICMYSLLSVVVRLNRVHGLEMWGG